MPVWHLTSDMEVNVRVARFQSIFILFLLLSAPYLAAEKTLTIESPAGAKTITLNQDPEVVISYTPSGMKIAFSNIQMKVVCIEDPSAGGLCRLQAYDNEAVGGPSVSIPGTPGKPQASVGDGQATLTWSAPTDNGGADIIGYRIQRAISGSTTFTTISANTGSASRSFLATGLTNGDSYVFRVAAINSAGTGSNSPQSDPVTPQGGSSSGGAYAAACDSVSGASVCVKLFNGDLAVGGFKTNQAVPDDKVLVIPLIKESAENYSGQIDLQSFQNDQGYFFDVWLSETPAGEVLNNDRNYCFESQGYAESIIFYGRGTAAGVGKCTIPSDDGLIWLNIKHWDPITNDLRAYNIQLFTIAPDD